MYMKNKHLIKLFALSSIFFITSCGSAIALADNTNTTYLVLTSIGLYEGQKGNNVESLFLENTVTFKGKMGDKLPGKDKVTAIPSSQGVFSNWLCYQGDGSPKIYDKVPEENGLILYANFSDSDISLVSLSKSGEPHKKEYDLDKGETTFDPTGLTISALYSDNSTSDVTNSVKWSTLRSGNTSVVGSFTFGKDTKTIEISGLTIIGTSQENTIYLNTGGESLWAQADAWFAAYCWNESGNEWFELEKNGNLYSFEMDLEKYDQIIFTRMNPSYDELCWDEGHVWNQTYDLKVEGNCYTITGWVENSNLSNGEWSLI